MKLLLFGLTLLFSVQTFAQIRFGVKVGGNLSDMMFDIHQDFGDEPRTKLKFGYHFGLISDIPLYSDILSLQPALLYSNKGYSPDYEKMLNYYYDQLEDNMDNFEGYVKLNYNYIELPINLAYKSRGLQFSAGPYFAVGIGGSLKHDYTYEENGRKVSSDRHFNESSYKLKPVYGKVDQELYDEFMEENQQYELYRAFDFGLNFGLVSCQV